MRTHFFWSTHAYLLFPGAADQLLLGGTPYNSVEIKMQNPHRALNLPADQYISYHCTKDHGKLPFRYSQLPRSVRERDGDDEILLLMPRHAEDMILQYEGARELGGGGDNIHSSWGGHLRYNLY